MWLPDAFGFLGALPQIMKKSGIRYFLTTKMGWNDADQQPDDTFLWEGIDGSRVTGLYITTKNYEAYPERFEKPVREVTYNGRQNASQTMGTWQNYRNKELNDAVLTIYGYGDGGGGPTEGMLEESKRLSYGIPGVPKVKLSGLKEYLQVLDKNLQNKKLNTWYGDLYLEYHRGTFSSIAENKKNNRICEYKNQQAEWLASLLWWMNKKNENANKNAYPKETLDKAWKLLLLNQFHDILPGSAIDEVYEQSDIDYAKIQLYSGNYDFWYESSQLMIKQMKEANRKKEEKIKELQEFIQRFSANASKSKQATSRKRALEKIQLDDMRPSSRKYPYIDFRPDRTIGNEVLTVENLSKTIDGVKVLDNISFTLRHDDKVAFVGSNELAKTTLFQILMGEMEPDSGSFKWGVTTSQAYFPKDNSAEFDSDLVIYDWLQQYSPVKDITYVRGFLGRMLFAGDDGAKKVRVLSGGEKVRCMLSKMMISGANVLVFDEPTNHLDMESITALNNGMMKFPGVILFSSRDHQIVQTTANRIIELLPGGFIDKITTYDEYLASDEMAMKRQVYTANLEDDVEPDGEE